MTQRRPALAAGGLLAWRRWYASSMSNAKSWWGVAMAVALAACAAPPAGPAPAASPTPEPERRVSLALPTGGPALVGVALAPPGLVAAGDELIARDAGALMLAFARLPSVAGNDAGSLAGPRGVRLMAMEGAPLADAVVYLADAGGKRLKDFPAARTGPNGAFAFQRLPFGEVLVVAVLAATADGKLARLQAMAGGPLARQPLTVDPAATIVSRFVLDDAPGALAGFDAALHKKALERCREVLGPERAPDWTSMTDIRRWAEQAGDDRMVAALRGLRGAMGRDGSGTMPVPAASPSVPPAGAPSAPPS